MQKRSTGSLENPSHAAAQVPAVKRRLVLLTEIISPYRIPVFNALAGRTDIDLHVIFLAETDSTQRQWHVYKDEICFSYEVLPSWRRRIGGYHVLLNRGLSGALRRVAPDVIVCGGYNYVASWECLWWARRHRVPFMVWVESTAKDLRGGRVLIESLKQAFMNRCDAFVVSGKSSSDYVRHFGAREDSIYVAPDAVDTDLFAARSESARQKAGENRNALCLPERYFLYVGRLVHEKGIFDLLEAYGRLSPELRSAVGLVFVGDGPARHELQQRAATISPGEIHFAGFAQREELAKYYALSEVFVFPTHTDPWGLVVNEAMACGLPILCTDAAGCAADLVEDHWNGRLVPAKDVGQLTTAMEELAGSADLRSLMSQRSRERIQMYSPAVCANGIAQAALSREVPRCD